mgnify:FL=1
MDDHEQTNKGNAVEADWHNVTLTRGVTGYSGNLRIRFQRSGNTLTLTTEEYMISGDSSRNKANINYEVKVGNNTVWDLDSPDDRKQDGQWHTWSNYKSVAIPSGTQTITFRAEFIFDMSGPDDRAIATHAVSI